ncbi:DUF1620-domain-containing protein [Lichtheimia hyalospora FSU 10163]|nr:DUF1620-domain-containing protein [Lichtheimia hyalospora FSU 10163]
MTMPSSRRKHIHFLSALFLLLSCIAIPATAIYASQAGIVDWHHTWIGKARWSALTAPSQLVVSTERNMLASINTDTGAIVWRQELNEPVGELQASTSGVLTFSSTGAQMWDPSSGRLFWQQGGFDHIVDGRITSTNVAVIVDKHHITALDLTNGHTLWTNDRVADHSLVTLHPYDDTTLYVIERSDNQDAFNTIALDINTGKVISNNKLSTQKMIDNIKIVDKHLLWTERDVIRWNQLGTKKIQKATVSSLIGSLASFASAEPEAVRLDVTKSDVVFLSAFNIADDQLMVPSAAFRMQENGLNLIQDLGAQDSVGKVDALVGTTVQVARTSDKEMTWHIVSDDHVHQEYRLSHDFSLTGNVEYVKLVSTTPLRALIVTSSGSTFLYDGPTKEMIWSREEAMAHATASEFLELPEKQLWTQMADEIAEEHPESIPPLTRYVHRLQAHMTEARQLPQWIIQRVMGAVKTDKAQPADTSELLQAQQCWTNATTPAIVYRDAFGLHKFVLTVTSTGKVIAQNTADRGSIVWSRYFEDVRFTHVELVRSVSVKMPPLIVAIGESGSPSLGYEETHLYRLDALTGEDYISHIPEADMYFEPALITETKIAKVMRLPIEEPDEHTHLLALYEAGTSRVYIYPDTEGARMRFREFADSFYFVQPSSKQHDGFKGYHIVEGYRGSLTAKPAWTLDLPLDEKVVAVGERQPYEKVALLGRVLGNRNVMYKYLNPHMFAVLSTNPDQETLAVRLVDGVKGTILYETLHRKVDAVNHAVQVVQAEHWVIYHFWSTDAKTRGYQAVVLELYEGEWENERVIGTNFSSYDNIRPNVQSSAFMFPYSVQSIGVTTTRGGVSTREILFGLSSNQIFGVNKGFFDPRRPRDKPTKEEQEEGLIPYAPIPDERQMFLTYNREVLGIKRILTSPALLESTSLVFSYGLDTFFTQSSPSRQFDVLSEDFSKSQLILTMVGLVVAIVIARPIVRRKRVNALWQ